MKSLSALFFAVLLILSFSLGSCNRGNHYSHSSRDSDTLFNYARVWDLEMRFTPGDWEALTPKTPGGFGPLGFFAPGFMAEGDVDGNNELSKQEFTALGKNWFLKWDEKQDNLLDKDQLEKGIGAVVDGINGGRFILFGSEGERNGLSTVLGVEFSASVATLEVAGLSFDSVSVRNKGNGTYMNARPSGKFSFKLDLDDGHPGRNLAGTEKINLHNCITDPGYMIEVLSYKLFRDAGVPAPRTSYAKLHVSVPGQFEKKYLGLYSVIENVDKNFIADRFGTSEGAILKPVTPFLFTDLGDDWKAYKQVYDPKTKLSDKEKSHLIDLCRLATHSSDEEFEAKIGDFLNLDEAARFFAVTVLISDLDGILGQGQNFYLYLDPEDNRFIFIPWDQDHSFGQFKRTQEEREKLSIEKPWDGENRFLERLFTVKEFKSGYLSHLAEINNTLFQPGRIVAQVNEIAQSLRPAVADESTEKLALFDRLVTMDAYLNESAVPEGFVYKGLPGGFGSEKDVKTAQGFVVQRTKSVKEQLEGTAVGMTDESEFTFSQMTTWFEFSKVFFDTMDKDKNGYLTSDEFNNGFDEWYRSWTAGGTRNLRTKEIRAGLNSIYKFTEDISGS